MGAVIQLLDISQNGCHLVSVVLLLLHVSKLTSVSTLLGVLPNIHVCFYNVWGTRKKNVFYFFYKITRRKLKRGNQSLNCPYR